MTAPLRLGGYSVGDLQLLTAVDGVAVKAVECLDLLVANAAAQILLGNAPEDVALGDAADILAVALQNRDGGVALVGPAPGRRPAPET